MAEELRPVRHAALSVEHEPPTFQDELGEWMHRAPWLAISAALHAVLALIIAAIPWHLFQPQPELPVIQQAVVTPTEVVDEPPPEVDEDIEPLETDDVVDLPVVDDVVAVSDVADLSDDPLGPPLDDLGGPFEGDQSNADLGVGGGAAGGGGGLGGPRSGGRPKRTDVAIERGLMWLARHQDADGRWDSAGFMKHDPPDDRCGGPGDAIHDVGVTALALLAFLGDGHTLRSGTYRENVARAVKWLRGKQDPESGLVGDAIGHAYLYDHALATLALAEAYRTSRSPLLRGTCERALRVVDRARDPYGAWRYDLPSSGDADSSVTGWMVLALKAGRAAGLAVDEAAFQGALALMDRLTDPGTGRCGYVAPGERSSRIEGVNDEFPTEGNEALTGVALLTRFMCGEDPTEQPLMAAHARLLTRSLPEWSPAERKVDMYAWYYGTYALYQFGGPEWRRWEKALEAAVLASVRRDGAHEGSWDPVGPWGSIGGRVYSTALMVLCAEVYYRYDRLSAAR